MKPGKIFLLVGNKIYPFVALPVLIWFWIRSGGLGFMCFVLGLPLLFGYIVPGIGTNVIKMWRFKDRWTVGNFFIHHGFIYAATMGSVMLIAFVPPASHDWWGWLANMARGAGLLGFTGWVHDLIGVREGMMEVYNEEWKRGEPAEVIVAQYAPLCFSLLGACYAGFISLGYQTVVLDQNPASLWWLFPLGLLSMSAVTTLPFLGWIRNLSLHRV